MNSIETKNIIYTSLSKKNNYSIESVKLKQIRSTIRNTKDVKQTLLGLKLGKINRESVLSYTPEIMGMVRKVSTFLKVEFLFKK